MNVLLSIVGVAMLIIMGLSIAGTAGVQFRHTGVNGTTEILFTQQKFRSVSGTLTSVYTLKKADFAIDCPEDFLNINIAFIFGIISIAISALSVLCALFLFCCKRWPKILLPGFVFVSWLMLLITWGMAEGIRNRRTCRQQDAGLDSYKDQGYTIGYGLALLISAWCVSCFILALSVYFWWGTDGECGPFSFRDDDENKDDDVKRPAPQAEISVSDSPVRTHDDYVSDVQAEHGNESPPQRPVNRSIDQSPVANAPYNTHRSESIRRDSRSMSPTALPFSYGVVVGGILVAPHTALPPENYQNRQQDPFSSSPFAFHASHRYDQGPRDSSPFHDISQWRGGSELRGTSRPVPPTADYFQQ